MTVLAPVSPVASALLILEAGLGLRLGLGFRRGSADHGLLRRLVVGTSSRQHRDSPVAGVAQVGLHERVPVVVAELVLHVGTCRRLEEVI